MKKVIESVLAGILLAGGVGLASTLCGANTALPQQQPVKNIVLVHGAFADGTSWGKVIPILESRGYHVVAVQNPLTSLPDDANATRRIIAMQDGPVILVGHSWGGSEKTSLWRAWPTVKFASATAIGADGASDLLQNVFGKDKNPTRLVYGVASLPLGTPVELELIFEVTQA